MEQDYFNFKSFKFLFYFNFSNYYFNFRVQTPCLNTKFDRYLFLLNFMDFSERINKGFNKILLVILFKFRLLNIFFLNFFLQIDF